MNLDQWLVRIDQQHPVKWDLGLARVGEVGKRLDILQPAPKIILVAGTNGKGSTCEYLSELAQSQGLRVGKTTSPHLSRFNERICIDRVPAADEVICNAFESIDEARQEISLTYFEYGALAALYIFKQYEVDLAVLEIGLGGRLDALNIVEPSLSIITRIALDHQSWLGDTRDLIAVEKAGILRTTAKAVIADPNPPASLIQCVVDVGCSTDWIGSHFGYDESQIWFSAGKELVEVACLQTKLPRPSLVTAVQALQRLEIAVDSQAVARIAEHTCLPGRFQQLPGQPAVILDVAHNPDAAMYLAERLSQCGFQGRVRAVVGMYADKDYKIVLGLMSPVVDHFYLTGVSEARAATPQQLWDALDEDKQSVSKVYGKVPDAFSAAVADSQPTDVVLVFGSFPVVGSVLASLEKQQSETSA